MGNRPPIPWPPRGMPVWMAAYYVGLSETALLTQEAAGEFHATWLTDGRKVYLREDLDAYLDRRRDGGKAPPDPANDLPDWQRALLADGKGDAAVR